MRHPWISSTSISTRRPTRITASSSAATSRLTVRSLTPNPAGRLPLIDQLRFREVVVAVDHWRVEAGLGGQAVDELLERLRRIVAVTAKFTPAQRKCAHSMPAEFVVDEQNEWVYVLIPEPLTWTGPTAQVRRADPTPPRTTARSPPRWLIP
jgi:hypothetical protein